MTRQRELIINILKQSDRHLTADEIFFNYKNNLFLKGGVSYGSAFLVVLLEKAIFMALEMLFSGLL